MFILLITSTEAPETLEIVQGCAQASITRGHSVIMFFNSQSTKFLSSKRNSNLQSFIEKGARLLACRTSAQKAGLSSQGDLIEGAEMSSLGELVDLFEVSDRTLFLG